jgi:hypothetical protein
MATTDLLPVFDALRDTLRKQEKRLAIQKDEPGYYALDSRKPSPFAQHKGRPMALGAVKLGKASVSYHLVPLYMDSALMKHVSPALKKRMQGKACFNFKAILDDELLRDLRDLTEIVMKDWKVRGWA